jgi:hypothetical protein
MASRRAARVGNGTPYNGRSADGAEPLSGGPTILFDHPRAGIPRSSLQSFPFGPATLRRRVQSRGALGAGAFQRGPQAGTDGEEAADGEETMATRRAARAGIGAQYNARYAG